VRAGVMAEIPATEKQLKMLWSLQKRLGIEPKWFDDMSKRQAQELISDMVDKCTVIENMKINQSTNDWSL
jgi:hypothetical protein